MAILNKDAILASNDLPKEEVQVDEWGGSVYVRTMTASERDRFETHFRPGQNVRALLAVCTVCDENGKAIFDESDVTALGAKSAAALDKVFTVAIRLNGIGKRDVEELEGESPASH